MTDKTTDDKQWEEEFDEEFPKRNSKIGEWTIWDKTPHPEDIKKFLRKALASQRAEIIKEVVASVPEFCDHE